jgi:hypothetical protein
VFRRRRRLFIFVGCAVVILAAAIHFIVRPLRILPAPVHEPVLSAVEPSGILVHPQTADVWIADDEGFLIRVPADGSEPQSFPVPGDVEDLCWHEPTGLICLVAESPNALILFDPKSSEVARPILIDAKNLMPDRGRSANEGF